jgi:hypothetical protein
MTNLDAYRKTVERTDYFTLSGKVFIQEARSLHSPVKESFRKTMRLQ